MKRTFTCYWRHLVLILLSVSCFSFAKAEEPKESFWEMNFNGPFELPEGWQNLDHNSSGITWVFTGMRAEIANFFEEPTDPRTHSSLISKAIDCSNKTGVMLSVSHALFYFMGTDSYYARIHVSNDGNTWTQVHEYVGEHEFEIDFIGNHPTFEFDISAVADNQSQVFLRFEFKGNDDMLGWGIQKMSLKTGGGSLLPLPAKIVSPQDGHNVEPVTTYIEWDWVDGPQPDGYRLYIDEVNPPQTMVYNGSNYSYAFNPAAEKQYFWKVVPYNAEGDAVDVPVWSFTTYNMLTLWEEDFTADVIDWPIVNHSGATNQWEFESERAWIYTPLRRIKHLYGQQ
jgi:hypothetical protein